MLIVLCSPSSNGVDVPGKLRRQSPNLSKIIATRHQDADVNHTLVSLSVVTSPNVFESRDLAHFARRSCHQLSVGLYRIGNTLSKATSDTAFHFTLFDRNHD
jgi:hypothetical protein